MGVLFREILMMVLLTVDQIWEFGPLLYLRILDSSHRNILYAKQGLWWVHQYEYMQMSVAIQVQGGCANGRLKKHMENGKKLH